MAKINRKKQIRNLAFLGLALACVAAAGFGLSRLGRTKDEPKQKQDKKEERAYEPLTAAQYAKANVNELGNVPIMMYHGIQNMSNADTAYTGGNIDVDGYQRTAGVSQRFAVLLRPGLPHDSFERLRGWQCRCRTGKEPAHFNV